MKLISCENCAGVFNANALEFIDIPVYLYPVTECPVCNAELFDAGIVEVKEVNKHEVNQ